MTSPARFSALIGQPLRRRRPRPRRPRRLPDGRGSGPTIRSRPRRTRPRSRRTRVTPTITTRSAMTRLLACSGFGFVGGEHRAELVGQRDRDHPLFERDASAGSGIEHEPPDARVPRPRTSSSTPASGQREFLTGEATRGITGDRPVALQPRERSPPAGEPSNRQPRSPSSSMSSACTAASMSVAGSAGRGELGDPMQPRHLVGTSAWHAAVASAHPTTSWPTSSPITSRITVVSTSSALSIDSERYGPGQEEVVRHAVATTAASAPGALARRRSPPAPPRRPGPARGSLGSPRPGR